MTHRPIPPAPGSQPAPQQPTPPHIGSASAAGYAPGTYYAPGWTEAQMAGPPPPREPRTRKPRRIRLWVVLSIVLALVLAVVVWLVLSPATWHALTGATKKLPADVTSPQNVNSRQLSAGNCIDSADNLRDVVAGIRVVPCADSHEAQVLSAYEFSEDAEWDGTKETQNRVTRSCTLSTSEADAGYTLLALTPTEESWEQGDRTGLCVAVAAEPVSTSLL